MENNLNVDYENLTKEILENENLLESLKNKDVSNNNELNKLCELGKKINIKELFKHFSRSALIILISFLFLNNKALFLILLLGGFFSDTFFTAFKIFQKDKIIERKKQVKLLELQNELNKEQEELKNIIAQKKNLLEELENKIEVDIAEEEKDIPVISHIEEKEKVLSLTRKKGN